METLLVQLEARAAGTAREAVAKEQNAKNQYALLTAWLQDHHDETALQQAVDVLEFAVDPMLVALRANVQVKRAKKEGDIVAVAKAEVESAKAEVGLARARGLSEDSQEFVALVTFQAAAATAYKQAVEHAGSTSAGGGGGGGSKTEPRLDWFEINAREMAQVGGFECRRGDVICCPSLAVLLSSKILKVIPVYCREETVLAWNALDKLVTTQGQFMKETREDGSRKYPRVVRRLLVEGSPGCGKTTIVFLWSIKQALLGARVLLLCRLSNKVQCRFVTLHGEIWRTSESISVNAAAKCLYAVVAQFKPQLVVVDGFVREAGEKIWTALTDDKMNGIASVLSTSLSFDVSRQQSSDSPTAFVQFHLCSWSLADYEEAYQCEQFCQSLSGQHAPRGMSAMRDKYFFAGGSARFMFEMSQNDISEIVDVKIRCQRAHDQPARDAYADAVNTLTQRLRKPLKSIISDSNTSLSALWEVVLSRTTLLERTHWFAVFDALRVLRNETDTSKFAQFESVRTKCDRSTQAKGGGGAAAAAACDGSTSIITTTTTTTSTSTPTIGEAGALIEAASRRGCLQGVHVSEFVMLQLLERDVDAAKTTLHSIRAGIPPVYGFIFEGLCATSMRMTRKMQLVKVRNLEHADAGDVLPQWSIEFAGDPVEFEPLTAVSNLRHVNDRQLLLPVKWFKRQFDWLVYAVEKQADHLWKLSTTQIRAAQAAAHEMLVDAEENSMQTQHAKRPRSDSHVCIQRSDKAHANLMATGEARVLTTLTGDQAVCTLYTAQAFEREKHGADASSAWTNAIKALGLLELRESSGIPLRIRHMFIVPQDRVSTFKPTSYPDHAPELSDITIEYYVGGWPLPEEFVLRST